ncbi:DNA repair exonuclease SbcCD ATPase subunit [Paenibacillus sp. PvR052]|nr:DNA repair exonuclease SbcCD ATPase subunit [Paenibacillus sp. PvP052]
MNKLAKAFFLFVGIYLAFQILSFTIAFILEHSLLFTILAGSTYLLVRYKNDLIRTLPVLRRYYSQTRSYTKSKLKQVEVRMEVLFRNIEEKQNNLMIYVREREQIAADLQEKNEEIKQLEQMLHDHRDSSIHTDILQQDLQEKLLEVQQLKASYHDMEAKISDATQKVVKLEQQRLKLLDERNLVTKQLDELTVTLKINEQRNHQMSAEIERLQEQQEKLEAVLAGSTSNDEVERIQNEIDMLRTQRESLEVKINELLHEKRNLERYRTELESTLKHTHEELEKRVQELETVRANETFVKSQLDQVHVLLGDKEKQLTSISERLRYTQEENQSKLEKAGHKIKSLTMKIDELIGLELRSREDAVALIQLAQENKELEEELMNARESSSMEKHILQKEYKPRFEKIYPHAEFHKEFFHDFIQLTTNDRINVEHEICLMHYRLAEVESKRRPNTVNSTVGNLLEMPFSSKGRIYYRHHQNRLYIYRVSKTEKDQKVVIRWLQNSLTA